MDANINTEIAKLFPALELILPANALAEFAAAATDDLCLFHFGLGLFLRNNILNTDSRIYTSFIQEGICHQDDMSSMVLSLFHAYLNAK